MLSRSPSKGPFRSRLRASGRSSPARIMASACRHASDGVSQTHCKHMPILTHLVPSLLQLTPSCKDCGHICFQWLQFPALYVSANPSTSLLLLLLSHRLHSHQHHYTKCKEWPMHGSCALGLCVTPATLVGQKLVAEAVRSQKNRKWAVHLQSRLV